MKRGILISALLVICMSGFAQKSYYFREPQKNITFQVTAGFINYDGMKYGASIGMNVKEIFSLSYFMARDYQSAEGSWLDSRLGGIHGTWAVPVNDCVQLAAGVRIASLNRGFKNEFQSPIYSAEMRMDLNRNLKLAFEYGMSKQTSITSLRLIFNIRD